MINPLEQFELLIVRVLNLGVDFSITNNTVVLIFISIFFSLITFIVIFSNSYFLNNWLFLIENAYNFLLSIIRQQISNLLSVRYFPFIFYVFSFILFANMVGLVPYGFTITGHIILTLQIALSIFIGITLINIINNKLSFLNLFIPSGVPIFLLPFLIIIEVVSYLIRPFSLSVRLFANMLAGHTLLHIMASFVFNLLKTLPLFVLLPVFFVFFIVVLEFCIAIVQAYIFTILTCIYVNDIYSTNH